MERKFLLQSFLWIKEYLFADSDLKYFKQSVQTCSALQLVATLQCYMDKDIGKTMSSNCVISSSAYQDHTFSISLLLNIVCSVCDTWYIQSSFTSMRMLQGSSKDTHTSLLSWHFSSVWFLRWASCMETVLSVEQHTKCMGWECKKEEQKYSQR